MNLHRVGRRPDWQLVEPKLRNPWQRLAARTNGVVAPANVLSITGAIVVGYGLVEITRGNLAVGLLTVGLGRLADILDGIVADATGTKSPLGEVLDAMLDKLEILATLVVLLWSAVIPLWAFGLVAAINVLGLLGAGIAKLRKLEIHPSQLGKLATVGSWVALLVYGLADLLAGSAWHEAISITAHVCLLASLAGNVAALVGYIQTVKVKRQAERVSAERLTPGFEQFLVVKNPSSTNAKLAARCIAELRRLFPVIPLETITLTAQDHEMPYRFLEQYADKLGPSTLVCIAGGDGTAKAVVEALLMSGNLPSEARLSVVLPLWGGNANDLATMINGFGSPGKMKDIFGKGKLMPIYPLECIMRMQRKGRMVRLAACYISFGALANLSRRLNEPPHRKSWLHLIPGGRHLQELATTFGALVESPTFFVTEHGTKQPTFEKLFANGSRIGRLQALPGQLNDNTFYQVDLETKNPIRVLGRLLEYATGRTPHHKLQRPTRFITHTGTWAQFDGEALFVPERTKVTIKLAREPFYTLSTKLKYGQG